MQSRSALIAWGIILLAPLVFAHADFVVAIGDLSPQPGGTGFVDVTIRSDNPLGDPLSAFGFEFSISGGRPRRLEFTSPQPDPQLSDFSYVFSGDSLDASVPLSVGSISTKIVLNDTFKGRSAPPAHARPHRYTWKL